MKALLPVIPVYLIAVLALVLGFVALLKQKVYLDSETRQPTEIEIPVLGKLRTNFPALVFVFLGVGLAWLGFDAAYPPEKTRWLVTGRFALPARVAFPEGFARPGEGEGAPNFALGDLDLHPSDFSVNVSPDGVFRIDALIPKGTMFEDRIETLSYAFGGPGGPSITWKPMEEYENFLRGEPGRLDSASDSTRRYGTLELEAW